ncbi:glycosidase [Psychroserpens sp. XS_ASV72]|uniref:alpha-amylase family glycosyl hydrolase n=1 Tax=Psychroserpens sp. XS_ASV72 TaxID=3241293 RepID=UPI003511A463
MFYRETSETKLNVNGVMLNAYPDSVGTRLIDIIELLKRPEFKDVFSLFYILPTFFNSDLDRGFSIIDYDLNKSLVSTSDLEDLKELGIKLKFDIVLNHLSVASPQFQDLLVHGNDSKYKDFFINWNSFWEGNGKVNDNGIIIPDKVHLDKLFMRKSGLPILNVPFPDGTLQPYWNTFYQKINYNLIDIQDLKRITSLTQEEKSNICDAVNDNIIKGKNPYEANFNCTEVVATEVKCVIANKANILGQMDVNAQSELVWEFYEDTLSKLKNYGCSIVRLDAFAYLHKAVGKANFFNTPGTWEYLKRIKSIAKKNNLTLLPEIHAEHGLGLHKEVSNEGYHIYDFFLPGLIIHTLEEQSCNVLLRWIDEILLNKYKTINMLGCHDGIPVLDLKGKETNGIYHDGLLEDDDIESIMNIILERGGRVKNIYDSEGNKISYYQINATYFSALGENEQKLLLARAIQLFMPGIPQIWYLDLFAGTNDYDAVEKAGQGGHKEINRTTLSVEDVNDRLKTEVVSCQLKMIRFRNTFIAFNGNLEVIKKNDKHFSLKWVNKNHWAELKVGLDTLQFSIAYSDGDNDKTLQF